MPGLALALREGTATAHRSAERAGYIRDLAQGRVDRPTYVRQLAAFHAIYGAMEQALDAHAADPVVSKLHDRALHRLAAIERDLATLAGPSWKASLVASPATTRYVERIRAAATHPPLLVAHAYTRYLGDLSGGQALKKLVARTLQLDGAEGLEFFEFPAIPDHTAFKQAYREALDALPVDDALAAAIVEEARAAFSLNEALFDELSPAVA